MQMSAFGFEVQGYSSGISKEDVKSLAGRHYQLIDREGGSIEAVASGKEGIYFNFCNDKLSGVNIFWNATVKNLVLVSNDFQAKYGNAISRSKILPLSNGGALHSLELYWYKGKDNFSIYYGSSEVNDSMTVAYSTKTTCSK
jgi:hypothetical protein